MSMNFDTLFGPYQDRIFINYDWVDVDSATGYVSYEGFITLDNSSAKPMLQKSSDRYSLWTYYTSGYSCSSGDYRSLTKVLDVDFDTTEFQKERIIKGTAYIKTRVSCTGIGSGTLTIYVIPKIRKYDGSTETEIASAESNHYSFGGDSSKIYTMIATVPETVISIGQKIRLTIEVWAQASADTSTVITLWQDPQNVETDTDNKRLVFNCPFKLEDVNT
jgi:hypothetical protein